MKNQSQYRLMLCGGAVAALTGFMGFTQSALAASIRMQGAESVTVSPFADLGVRGLGELDNGPMGSGVTSATRMIDRKGLNTPYVNNEDQEAYLRKNPLHWDGISQEWFSEAGAVARGNRGFALGNFIRFDLGAVYDLRNIVLWNEDFAGVDRVYTYASQTTSVFDLTYLNTLNFRNNPVARPPASPNWIEPYQKEELSASGIQARYVTLFIQSVHANDLPNRDHLLSQYGLKKFASIGEVAFGVYRTDAPAEGIPTPALLPGLVGLGVSAWRKKRKATAV
jgi:hypothetical protein